MSICRTKRIEQTSGEAFGLLVVSNTAFISLPEVKLDEIIWNEGPKKSYEQGIEAVGGLCCLY